MKETIYLSASALLYAILIGTIFFAKKKFKTNENNIFSKLVIITIVSLVSELLIPVIGSKLTYFWYLFTMKIYLICCIAWLSTFIEYAFIVSRNDQDSININYKERYNKLYKIYTAFTFVIMLIVLILPIHYYQGGTVEYSYGPAVDLTFGCGGLYLLFILIILIKNRKHLKNKGYWPIIFLAVLFTAVVIIQKLVPGLLLINFTLAFITSIMYHTIENPDIKMVEELSKNRRLVEKHNESKSNLLFKISQDVRQPIKEIISVSDNVSVKDDINEIKEGIRLINYDAKQVSSIINNVLNISEIDVKNIKVFENTYVVPNLYNEIVLIMKNQMKDNIDFRYSISDDVPKTLYGDPTKIKQIICSVLSNSIKHTENGFIELNINAIVRYDICRLIISIEDSGSGMELEKINSILESDAELSKEDIEQLDSLDVNLKNLKKIINVLGGNLLIKSKVDKGSTFTIVLDQIMPEIQKDVVVDKINNFSKIVSNKKRVLVIDDDPKELDHISKILNNNNLEVVTAMYSKECIDRIKSGEKYDLILLDDEMVPDSAVSTFNQLQEIPKFKIKTVIMLEKNKEFIKEDYLNDYTISDYLLKDKLKEELERIIKKYIF